MKKYKNIIIIFITIMIIFSMTGHVFADELILGGALDNSDEYKKENIGSSSATSVLAGLEESSSDLKEMVSITENGYEINGNYALRIIKALENAAVDTYAYGFRDEDYDITQVDDESQTYKSDSELTNIIDKYIRTEVRNMLPDIGSYARTAINGNVIVKRYTSKFGRYNASNSGGVSQEGGTDFGEGITLKYIPYEELKELSKETVQSYETIKEYLGYFSINPIGMKLCVLTSSEEYIWEYNNITPKRAIDDSGTKDPVGVELLPDDYETASKIKSTFELKEYEYLNLLEQTATPINYFIAMQLITQDVDFMNEFIEKCNKENSYIELGFLESTESTFEHYNYGTDEKDVIRGAKLSTNIVDTWNQYDCCNDIEEVVGTDEEGNDITEIVHNPHDNGEGEIIDKKKGNYIGKENEVAATLEKYVGYKVKDFLNVKIQNTGDLYLIEADTWNINYKLIPHVGQIERPFRKIQNVKQIKFPEDPVKEVERLEDYPKRLIGEHCSANDYSYLYEWKNTHFYIYEAYAKWTNKYNVYSVVNGNYKTDIIINLLKKYPKVENNISSASYLLFTLLEQNGNTQELERYMRYILSDMSGHQYLTDNTKELEFNFSIGLSDDNLYNYNYNGSTTKYAVNTDSSANSSKTTRLSGGSGKTKWYLEKKTKISTTDQDGEPISTREYYYFKQGTGTNICGRTSLATCLSGLGIKNPNTGNPYTPLEISPQNTNNWFSWSTTLGVKATRYTNNLRGKLIEHLSTGNPAIVHIKANSDPNNVYNTKGGHFIAVVGIKYSGDALVYVLDPGSSKATRTENYISINTVLAYADEIRTFSK